MSDLIDFDSPNTNNIGSVLPSPLIPAPENARNDGPISNEAGPHITESEKRRSTENNPFDMVMKKIMDYERNKEDPFERVIEKVKEFGNKVSDEPKDIFRSESIRYSDIVKRNKTLEEIETNVNVPLMGGEVDMSIITDLNNTNLISDSTNENQVISLLSCDNKIPNIQISSTSCNTDLSILNNSSMNDSLLDQDNNIVKDTKNLHIDFNNRRSMSQTNVLGSKKSPQIHNRRSMSASDTLKSNIFGEDFLINSAHSSIEDPFNNAFRKSSLRSTISSNSSYLSNQFDLSINKQNLERQTSNSSVFSGLSNISSIPTDPVNKTRHDRLCSESSVFSGISNLSTISSNNVISSSDSSVFSNDTLNKGFITSRIRSTDKSPVKSRDKTDLIKKYFEIKTRMSTSEIEQPKNEDKKKVDKKKCHSFSKSNDLQKEENLQNSDEKLIDVDSSFNSVFNDETGVNDIILHEARLLAETFEKMASSKESNSPEDDLLSKTQLNFDYLPKSDDEAVDNLIDLPASPTKNILLSKIDAGTEKDVEQNVISPEDNIRALENEFIEKKDFNKKAVTATLLLDLEKLIKEENNPDAHKVLNDLQKLLGVECDNNTEILQLHLQNTNDSLQNINKDTNELHTHKDIDNKKLELNTKQNIDSYCKNNSFNLLDIPENKENNINSSNSKLHVLNKFKEKITKNEKVINNSQCIQESDVKEKNLNNASENESLANSLINTLNKIVNEKNENSAVDILRSLGTALSMATELRVKKTDKRISDSKISKRNTPMKLNRSSNFLFKSPSPTNIITKNQSFEVLPLRRSISTNPINNNNLLDISFTKDKRKSHLLNIKKRFPSDPGFKNLLTDKKINETPTLEQQYNFKTNATTIEQVKPKFKKKFNSEMVPKKGPLKAVIPLGNMQKRGLVNQKLPSHNVTPPKSVDSVPAVNIVSSTPNTSGINKNSKSEPTASSTPNIEGLRTQRVNTQRQRNSKSTSMCNVSPVSLNSSLKVAGAKNTNKRLERTLSPQKRPFTPRKNFESSESRLPRYSPRPVRVRKYSYDDLKTAKSPQNTVTVPKFSSEKKFNRQSFVSPLKNCNKLTQKGKIVSRLGKPSNVKSDLEKENYV